MYVLEEGRDCDSNCRRKNSVLNVICGTLANAMTFQPFISVVQFYCVDLSLSTASKEPRISVIVN